MGNILIFNLHVYILLFKTGRTEGIPWNTKFISPVHFRDSLPLWPSEGICVLVSDRGGSGREQSLFILTCSVVPNVLSHK